MIRPTPNCHLTIGPLVPTTGDFQGLDWVRPDPQLCIGSACSAWEQLSLGDAPPVGRCALVRPTVPWLDPAAEGVR